MGAEASDWGRKVTAESYKPVRLIARLDIKGKNLIKGIRFEGLRVVGIPNERAREYYAQGVDELLYIDAVASLYDRNYLEDLVRDVAQDVFIPVTVGGGIRKFEDVKLLLRAGADKVAINTAAVKNPELISQVAESFGSQCMVLSVEAKRKPVGGWEVYVEGGRERTGRDVFEWIDEATGIGAGEVLVTSVDKDGLEKGADLELIEQASLISPVPVIASGGIGDSQHALEILGETSVDAIAVGSALHYGRLSILTLRTALRGAGLGVRQYEP